MIDLFNRWGSKKILMRAIKKHTRMTGMITDAELQLLDFSKLSFTGLKFLNCNFEGSLFKGADLRGAKFISCNMSKCDFTNALIDENTLPSCFLNNTVGLEDQLNDLYAFNK